MLKINEVFYSIQGESSLSGWPTVFVRLTGCNLRCTYCDTTYSYYDGSTHSFEDLLAKVKFYKTKYVCITGGEPLLQKGVLPFMTTLCDQGFVVSLETGGSIFCGGVDSRVKKVIDVKTPDSGAADSFNLDNLAFCDSQTEFKFVICSEKDFDWAENFCLKNKFFEKSNVFYSPSFRVVSEKWLAEKILSTNSSARLQLQLHKYIWSPDSRGV